MLWWNQRGDDTSVNGSLMTLAYSLAARLQCGQLTIIAPNAEARHFKGDANGPNAVLQLNSARAIRRFAVGGSLGFAEAYLDGDWDSPDLPSLLELLVLNESAYEDYFYGRGWYRWLARVGHVFRPNSRRGQPAKHPCPL